MLILGCGLLQDAKPTLSPAEKSGMEKSSYFYVGKATAGEITSGINANFALQSVSRHP